MKIVHEIEGRAQIVAGGYAGDGCYANKVGEEGPSKGFRAEILICVPGDGVVPEENIHIEGNAKHVLKALQTAMALLIHTAKKYVEDGKLRSDWKEL